MLIRIIRTIRVDLKKIIISKDRTNEDIRRRAIMLYVPRPKLRILDTESTMWSDPSKAVVPFAIQISERGGGGGGQECHRNEAVIVGSRDHDETFPLLRQSAIHRLLRVSFLSSFASFDSSIRSSLT